MTIFLVKKLIYFLMNLYHSKLLHSIDYCGNHSGSTFSFKLKIIQSFVKEVREGKIGIEAHLPLDIMTRLTHWRYIACGLFKLLGCWIRWAALPLARKRIWNKTQDLSVVCQLCLPLWHHQGTDHLNLMSWDQSPTLYNFIDKYIGCQINSWVSSTVQCKGLKARSLVR